MTNTQDMISTIFHYIKNNGKLINRAQSDWGQDRWEYNGLIAGLGDGGYTQMIQWGDRLRVWSTYNYPPLFDNGDNSELIILFEGIKNASIND